MDQSTMKGAAGGAATWFVQLPDAGASGVPAVFSTLPLPAAV